MTQTKTTPEGAVFIDATLTAMKFLSACGQKSNQNEVSVSNDTRSTPLPSALLAVDKTNLIVDVVVDGGMPQTCANLSVNQVNGTYSCNITLLGGQQRTVSACVASTG